MPAELYELSMNCHDASGNFFMSRWNFELVSSGTTDPWALAGDLITAFIANVEPKIAHCLGSDIIIDFYKAKRVKPLGGPSNLKISGVSGLAATESMSSGVAADIVWQNTNASNKPGHTFVGGVFDGALIGSQWQAGLSAAIATLIVELITGFAVGATTATLSILSKKVGTWTHATHGNLSPKPTMMNKRTLPLV
jgi:hypothetical protein